MISWRANAVTATMPVGSGPYGVAANPKTSTAYVTNPVEDTVSVISGRANAVTATTPVRRGPFMIAANPKTNTTYVTNFDGTTVSVLAP